MLAATTKLIQFHDVMGDVSRRMDFGPFQAWPATRTMQKKKKRCRDGVPAQARATQIEVGLLLPQEWRYVKLQLKATMAYLCLLFFVLGKEVFSWNLGNTKKTSCPQS